MPSCTRRTQPTTAQGAAPGSEFRLTNALSVTAPALEPRPAAAVRDRRHARARRVRLDRTSGATEIRQRCPCLPRRAVGDRRASASIVDFSTSACAAGPATRPYGLTCTQTARAGTWSNGRQAERLDQLGGCLPRGQARRTTQGPVADLAVFVTDGDPTRATTRRASRPRGSPRATPRALRGAAHRGRPRQGARAPTASPRASAPP